MKTGYTVQHDKHISDMDTVMEVINYSWKNTITFYSWRNRWSFKKVSDTIGVWRIKSLKQ
jgi:hypothetical protein